MSGSQPPPIAAASLRAREEWRRSFPDSRLVWEEDADEGQGIGFDGLDPSAMVRGFFRTAASWTAVLGWYADLLARLGWEGSAVRGDWWWEWTSPDRPGERFTLMDRSRSLDGSPRRTSPEGLRFEVLFRASSGMSAPRSRHA